MESSCPRTPDSRLLPDTCFSNSATSRSPASRSNSTDAVSPLPPWSGIASQRFGLKSYCLTAALADVNQEDASCSELIPKPPGTRGPRRCCFCCCRSSTSSVRLSLYSLSPPLCLSALSVDGLDRSASDFENTYSCPRDDVRHHDRSSGSVRDFHRVRSRRSGCKSGQRSTRVSAADQPESAAGPGRLQIGHQPGDELDRNSAPAALWRHRVASACAVSSRSFRLAEFDLPRHHSDSQFFHSERRPSDSR